MTYVDQRDLTAQLYMSPYASEGDGRFLSVLQVNNPAMFRNLVKKSRFRGSKSSSFLALRPSSKPGFCCDKGANQAMLYLRERFCLIYPAAMGAALMGECKT